ncbi:sperm microtubule associated protein 2 isoform X2 [Hypanus sabinus]|nr:sperm microtubule associated protein 2 isoform X2 [Hypanus sabinus]XP_059847148.1 sperm microtubule associated protein 2 isoform X2 [Hypanus sabinus]XP_059847149.1 sperm microtubule associated protein 2 isoform X2 [Hypanus sabinus]
MGQGNAPRYIKLSEYKKLNKNFQPNRPAIWPVKPATMQAKPTARIQQLAKLKPSYNDMKRGESEDKAKTMNSVNFKGKKSGSKKEPVIYADVPRFVYLSEPKKLAAHFVGNRPSPVWPLRSATLNARPSPRISELAKSKQLHKDWQADRSPYTMVSQDILYIENLPRTAFLAQHKKQAEPPMKSSHLWDYPYWDNEISEATKSYSPSERIQKLAKPKGDYAGYILNRSLEEPISESTLNYSASERIQELAKPKIYTALAKIENPFTVSEAAKKAVASPRLEKLAIAIPRKVTLKKTG